MSKAPKVSSRGGGFGGTKRHLALEEMCLRIGAYLRGCFERGAWYKIWDKHQFHRATKSHRPRTVGYIEHAFRVFMRTTSVFEFEKIRIGRSERIKVMLIGSRSVNLSRGEVANRLAGYVRRAVLTRGVAHVDLLFLERFCATSGLPREFVIFAWQKMKRIPGLRVRWKGSGRSRKFIGSLPHFPTRSSSPNGEKRSKISLADVSNRSSGPDGPGETAREQPDSSPPTRRQPIPCPDPPFQVCQRWVSSSHLFGRACWLAYDPMQAVHLRGWRVCWRYAHARNFAYRALRDGHRDAAIVDAWRRAVDQSHEDSLDADRAPADSRVPLREPSCAVVYARRVLAADRRSCEARWREIFEQPRRPRSELAVKRPRGDVKVTTTAAAPLEMPAEKKHWISTIEAALAQRKLSVAAFMRLGRAERDRIVAEIIAQKK